MDYVNFETAKQLKEAGFTQPEFEPRQVWYYQTGSSILFCNKKTDGRHAVVCLVTGLSFMFSADNPVVAVSFFAPTATDILRQLPGEFYLSCDKDGKYHAHFNEYDWGDNLRHFGVNENPAELLAAVWMERMKYNQKN